MDFPSTSPSRSNFGLESTSKRSWNHVSPRGTPSWDRLAEVGKPMFGWPWIGITEADLWP